MAGGGKVAEQQRNAAAMAERVSARPERGPCAWREARVHTRACAVGWQWRARKRWREEEEECGGRTRGPPPVAYMGGGGIEVWRGNPWWPGVAGTREKHNRQIGAEDPGVGKRNVQRGGRCLQLFQVTRGSWALAH